VHVVTIEDLYRKRFGQDIRFTDMTILLRAISISSPVTTCKLLKKDGLVLVAMLRSQQNDEIAADHGLVPER
jgi:hypothetical protein